MEKCVLLRHICLLNQVEIDVSVRRDKRLATLAMHEKLWSYQDIQEHAFWVWLRLWSVYGGGHSACPVLITLFIQFLLQVQRHLSKLFDNLAKMKFQLDSEQKPTKIGLGMYSREEEYVSFSEHCDCSGQVRRKPRASELSGGVCSPAPCLDFCRQDGVELRYSSFMRERLEEVVV